MNETEGVIIFFLMIAGIFVLKLPLNLLACIISIKMLKPTKYNWFYLFTTSLSGILVVIYLIQTIVTVIEYS